MPHRERQRRVGALLRVQPQVAELRAFRVIGEHRHDLGAAIARLDEEMRVGRARLRDIGAPHHDERRVVPVGRFRHVGLLAPGLRRRGRQVAVPVVEAQAHAADQRQVARAGRVRHHRHRRDRREADHAIGAVPLDRVHVCGRNDLVDLAPAGTHEAAEPSPALVRAACIVVLDNRSPCFDGAERAAAFAPQLHERAAHHRMLETVRAVQIPRVRRAARAAARLMVRHVGTRARVVGLLGFPGDDPAFHIDLPRARTRAVHAVGRADDLVVLPAHPVTVFPFAVFVGDGAMAVGKAWPRGGEITQSIQEMAHGDLVFPVFRQTLIV